MELRKSNLEFIDIELDIINSDPFFNMISKGKETFTKEEIITEITESNEFGAERFLIKDGIEIVGILEFLMKNPNDGHTWLGLLLIKKELQSKGYGWKTLDLFYDVMNERNVNVFRIGVISDNNPAIRFWEKQGFNRVSSTINEDDKEIIIYEKKPS